MKKMLLSLLVASSLGSVHATIFNYYAFFSSSGESLPSNAFGFGAVVYDDIAHTLALSCTFSGLSNNTTASHIHAPTASPFTGNASVATTTPSFAGFPLGVTSGTFNNVLDLTQASSYNPAFVTLNGGSVPASETALAAAMAAGKSYWNIHSVYDPGGEIRGFLTTVPEPSSVGLLVIGAGGLAVRAWKKKRAITG